ncbi:MAG: ABC transporter permease [Gammaproteobacteria bacterium]|nr:ABC transporter permease [Gammaproteobacteria bacterium]
MFDWRGNMIAYKTIVVREVRRFMRIWVQTITPPAMNALLYMVIFGSLIGSQLREMGGHPYIDFIVPGLIMMAVIVSSYSNVVSSFFSAKFQRHIEEMLVSPVHNLTLLAGYITGGVCRGLIVGLLVALVSLFFTRLAPVHLIITILVTVATAILFSLGGLINAVFARSFDDTSIITNFVLTPLTYLGGIFFSIDFLPEFWQKVSMLNPVLYMINGFRYGILGTSDINIGVTFAVIFGLIIVLGAIALHLLNRGIGIKQ